MKVSERCRVLLVEDDVSDAHLVQQMLRASTSPHFEVVCAGTLAEAQQLLNGSSWSMLLLDMSLPDSGGLDTIHAARDAAGDTPIIVLTGHDDTELALQTLELGVQDYLVKGSFNADGLVRSIRYAISRIRLERELHESESFATSTIDALSANICVLDESGQIVAVNQAWREFYNENYDSGVDSYFVGTNYLAVCDSAHGFCSVEGKGMADGIRDVIAGRRDYFMLEYPCHSATEQRWFIVRVTRFRGGSKHFVVAHENITARKSMEMRNDLLVAALEAVGNGVLITDMQSRVEWVLRNADRVYPG